MPGTDFSPVNFHQVPAGSTRVEMDGAGSYFSSPTTRHFLQASRNLHWYVRLASVSRLHAFLFINAVAHNFTLLARTATALSCTEVWL